LARFEAVDAQDSGEDEITEALAFVANARMCQRKPSLPRAWGDSRRTDSSMDVMDW